VQALSGSVGRQPLMASVAGQVDDEKRGGMSASDTCSDEEVEDRLAEKSEPRTASETSFVQVLVCAVLVFTNSANVISLRVSRTHQDQHDDGNETGPGYIISTAIIMAECIKILISIVLHFREYMTSPEIFDSDRSLSKYPLVLFEKIFVNWADTLQLAVPGGIYFFQNTILVFALSKLDSVTFQISYQLKILTTALFTVVVLKRSISLSKWIALSVLMMGVVLVQYPTEDTKSIDNGPDDIAERKDTWGTAIGLLAVLAACFSSGFAGVYFEKVLKGVKSSLWLRNIQLALVGISLGLPSTFVNHWDDIRNHGGFFQGYNHYVWIAVLFQASSGIAVALVIKYAGNLTKCLASAVAIIVSTIVSYFVLDDITLTPQFVVGGLVVLVAVFLYNFNWVRCVVLRVVL